MSQSFITSAVVFVIVMVIFHIVKDIIILSGMKISPTMRSKLNKRWLISTAIGLIILYLMYGCTDDIDKCDKGPPHSGIACTEIYQPVRAPDGTVYGNSCLAEIDGWDNYCITLVDG